MAFCSNCGSPITGNQKFCAQCGADVSAKPVGAASPAAMPAPGVTPLAPVPNGPTPAAGTAAPPVQPMASVPLPYVPAGAVPVVVPVQPAAQKKGAMGTVIVVLIAAALGYYYYSKAHKPAPPTPDKNPTTSQPAAPSSPPAGSGTDAALVNQQTFTAHWQDQSGMLTLTTASWVNNSNANITSATLQCRQYNSGGTDLSEYRVTLNGPTNANTSSTFSNISLGATATGMTRVDCTIVRVKPAS